jgi:uncharacterized protein (TIGR02145 family)
MANSLACSSNVRVPVTATFYPEHSLSVSSAIETKNQVVCQGTPITSVFYNWNQGASSVSLSWTPSTPAGLSNTSTELFGTPTTAGEYRWTITTAGNRCSAKTETGYITVSASPAPVIVSGTSPSCEQTTLTATGGAGGQIYWQNTTANGSSIATPATSRTVTARGTYYFRARSEQGCWGQQGSKTVVITTPPAIGTHPSAKEQIVVLGTATEFPTLSAAATGSPDPTFQWYSNTQNSNIGGALISNATTATFIPPNTEIGMFYYYVVISNPCGDKTSNVSGKHEVINPNIPGCAMKNPGWGSSLGTPYFKTDREWQVTYGTTTQIWSDVVLAPSCSKSSFNSRTYDADCRSAGTGRPTSMQTSNYPFYRGDFFSWCAAARFAHELCPAPWRLPTSEDFKTLDRALGGTGGVGDIGGIYLGDKWGGSSAGYCNYQGIVSEQGGEAIYWSSTESSAEFFGDPMSYTLRIRGSWSNPSHRLQRVAGIVIRCVR